MHPETEIFLSGLFQPNAEQAAFLTLTAIHPDGNHPTPSRHLALHDHAALDAALADLRRANEAGWGAYVGIAPRRADLGRWSRGKKSDLVGLPALFVDLDRREAVGQFPLPPSCLVSSGRGLHVYWWLKSPIAARDLDRADRALRGLARHMGADEGMTVAQSLRLVGSINTKAGRERAPCHLLALYPERRYDFAEFIPYLAPASANVRPREKSPGSRENAVRLSRERRQRTIPEVTQRLMRDYGGVMKRDGWLGALCPYGHASDRPGQHFFYHTTSGGARCFGRHGTVGLGSLCEQLGVDVSERRSFHL